MNFGFLAFITSWLVLRQIVVAFPTKSITVEVATVHDLSALKSAIPGHATLSETFGLENSNASSPHPPRDLDLGGPYLILCAAENCAGMCYSYDLSTLVGGCYVSELPYQSAIISSVHNGRMSDPSVYVSCGLPDRLTMRNVCYNVYYESVSYSFPYFSLS